MKSKNLIPLIIFFILSYVEINVTKSMKYTLILWISYGIYKIKLMETKYYLKDDKDEDEDKV